ncbi:MAG: TraB/GumN family protein [Algoriphagus sp.]|nr:TraB/GumN family protein [Algoriphagus sp.]
MYNRHLLKLTFTFCIFLHVSFLSFSQEGSLLWKISGNGLSKESYLFGTIHIICKEDFVINDRVKKAFESSEKLVMELDMSDPQLMANIQQHSLNPGMKNIQGELSEEDASMMDAFFMKNFGVGLAQIGILKPFVLSSMALIKTLPCPETESFEGYFTAQAQSQSKPIEGLETVEIQMGTFDQIPAKVQLDELVKMIKDESGAEEFKAMVTAYLEEDIEALYQTMNQDGMTKEYRGIMLDSRNKAWIPQLQEKMVKESVFVAVGSGHLAGENGVISLLKHAGYQVEPVK